MHLIFLSCHHCREGSIVVWYEVIGSRSLAELLSAVEQVAAKAEATLSQLFLLEGGSFRVFGKGDTGFPSFALVKGLL